MKCYKSHILTHIITHFNIPSLHNNQTSLYDNFSLFYIILSLSKDYLRTINYNIYNTATSVDSCSILWYNTAHVVHKLM